MKSIHPKIHYDKLEELDSLQNYQKRISLLFKIYKRKQQKIQKRESISFLREYLYAKNTDT